MAPLTVPFRRSPTMGSTVPLAVDSPPLGPPRLSIETQALLPPQQGKERQLGAPAATLAGLNAGSRRVMERLRARARWLCSVFRLLFLLDFLADSAFWCLALYGSIPVLVCDGTPRASSVVMSNHQLSTASIIVKRPYLSPCLYDAGCGRKTTLCAMGAAPRGHCIKKLWTSVGLG